MPPLPRSTAEGAFFFFPPAIATCNEDATMTLTVYGRDEGGFLLHRNQLPIGWVEGRAVGFRGFPTRDNAMEAARHPHAFLGIDADGQTCIVNTAGNPDGQLILRGGRSGPNYGPEYIAEARALLAKRNLEPHILVDCSHANSNKDYRNQSAVWRNVLNQRIDGASDILGMMVESNLIEGGQPLDNNPAALRYGVSITDSCIGWDETELLLDEAHALLAKSGATAAMSK